MRFVGAFLLLAALALAPGSTAAQQNVEAGVEPHGSDPDSTRWSSFLPLLSELATKRGIELPLPFGAGFVFYHLSRDIEVTDLRVGLDGAPPRSVSDFAQLSARADVENVNVDPSDAGRSRSRPASKDRSAALG